MTMTGYWQKLFDDSYKTVKDICLHKGCPSCKGTGRKESGEICVHHLSCSCKKCNPRF